MSVFDFIRKPTAQSNAPGFVPQAVVPSAPSVSAQPQIVPPINVINSAPPVASSQADDARQQYIASLLKKKETAPAPVPVVAAPVPLVQTPTRVAVTDPTPPVVAKTTDTSGGKTAMSSTGGELTRQKLLDIMTHLSQRSNKILLASQVKAREMQAETVDSEHLLAGLVTDAEILTLLATYKIDAAKVEAELVPLYRRGATKMTPQLSPRFKKIIENAQQVAKKNNTEFISPEHILLALFEEGEGAGARVLAKLGITLEDLQKKIATQVQAAAIGPDGKPVAGKTGEAKKSALAEFTIDMTAKAERGELDQCVERAEEIERVVHVLSRRTKNNPALVGEPGVGKTSIVEGLAQRIASRQVPEVLLGKRILQLDLMAVLAGASHRGEFEQRMKDLIGEVTASNGSIVMFIDEMHTIVGAGGTGDGSMDAANFLKPALARGDLQMIGATTLTEYRKYVEKDPALERRFQTVLIPEPSEEAAIKMLKALRGKYESFHKVKIPDAVIEAAVKLSKRYVGDRFLPDKAIDLMDESASAVRLPVMSLPERITSLETRIQQLTTDKTAAEGKNDTVRAKVLTAKIEEISPKLATMQAEYTRKKALSTVEVSEDVVKDVVSRWTGVPVSKMSGSETDKLTKLEAIMHERMIGQERAVSAVAAAVRRGRAGLKSNKRPIGSFVFLGPSGVGKTELTKTLAEVLFGQEDSMVRFDMTEFMEKHEVAKLIGPPPGYVGYEEGGKLTEAVRRKPYSVVLFDEVEKAHPDIFNILLQILDDGRLTDNKGRTISFKNTVIICTSNIGTQMIQDKLLEKMNKDGSRREEKVSPASASFKVGEQSDKKTILHEEQNREYTGMKKADVAASYQDAPAHFEEPELPVGFEYEDEAGGDMSLSQYTELKDMVMGELRKFFRPELINRFDEVIVFEPLQLKHMKKIVELQFKTLTKLLEEQNLGLTITDAAKEQVVTAGFDPVYGARPLRRAIQKLLENPISEMIIAKKAQDGDIILVDYDEEFIFTTEKPKDVMRTPPQKKKEAKKMQGLLAEEGVTVKKYRCIDSGYTFETAVYPNATVICAIDALDKVEEVTAQVVKSVEAPVEKSVTAQSDANAALTAAFEKAQMQSDVANADYQARASV